MHESFNNTITGEPLSARSPSLNTKEKWLSSLERYRVPAFENPLGEAWRLEQPRAVEADERGDSLDGRRRLFFEDVNTVCVCVWPCGRTG